MTVIMTGRTSTGFSASLQFQNPTTRATAQIVSGKTGTVRPQGSLNGTHWLNMTTAASTFSTAGRLVAWNLAGPVSWLRLSVSALGVGTTGATVHVVM